MHFAAIGRSISGALRALQNYQDNLDSAKARDKHRRAGRKHVLVLQLDLERALRGIEHWAMPGPAHALLLGALDFDSAEARRARQSFSVATDRDLVYVTDPRCCDLFLHVWGSPWCKKVRYLAVLVVDCAVQMEWYNSDVAVRARNTWPFQALLFEGCEVREIMLVVRPAVNPRSLPAEQSQRRERLLALPRDVYGFVDYGTLHGDTDLFSAMDSNVIKQNFTTYRRDLGEMIPEDLKQKIKLRFVVDLDCESIGMTNVEGAGAMYKRSLRN
ncbi:hypothetical protein GGS24DRAFT_404292 [Hypoxylon argillaceum]|nr:hypothetical protein GGS24DRAFT_404292 [Hypoxylon argillaceum]